ncbi:MAG TPA: radical SAM protein [Terriglobia bacterium]|jgi:MoaA/NifB/PqqE/SkfB family radical SAM enzyme
MADLKTTLRRKARFLNRRRREIWLLLKGILSTRHVVQAHIIPIRRCNLACSYCNEYDDYSKPVPLAEMLRRIDKLGSFGATLITISGGEPLLHPELEQIIARIRKHGGLAGLITNGYLLTRERIESLNRAGLDHLQISIDNAQPDDVSMKSLKVLDKKLQLLAEHAEFAVVINSVLGSGVKNPEDALTVARRARELGLSSSIGVIHDGSGQLRPLSAREHEIFDAVRALRKRRFFHVDYFQVNHFLLNHFQRNIADGKSNHWKCRAGARYLYVCEDGLVHYCSQQRGYPAIPLLDYTEEDLRREYLTQKGCAPLCTIACAQQTSFMDFWRDPQTLLVRPLTAPEPVPVAPTPIAPRPAEAAPQFVQLTATEPSGEL